jgi:hypothetical protein
MLETRISRRITIAATAAMLAMGAVQAAPAVAGQHVVPPPDRQDRIGAGPREDTRPVQLPPDRADGLGSARLPTMPTPVVLVRTVSNDEFDWVAALIGAAAAIVCGAFAAAARVVRAGKPAIGRL